MKAHFLKIWMDARASYWFWPSIMALSAIVLSIVTVKLDTIVNPDWTEGIPLIYANQAEGARLLLSTVAGSMITVTGITFSLTLLAVSQVTSQFGPRLLTNFMRDRGNQFTLGTFIATFLYCLMILRTVRSAEEAATEGAAVNDLSGAFVPHISIFVAILLTLASVGVLIYFIHHIPESIRLSNVVANIGRELLKSVDSRFPSAQAEKQPDTQEGSAKSKVPGDFEGGVATVSSNGDGYVQAIDQDGILSYATRHDLIMEIKAEPGDFISRGQSLVDVYPKSAFDDDMAGDLRFMFALGNYRTSTQNIMFLVDQLVEVIARALSPGINDPLSAITCMDWLQSALIRVAIKDDPAIHRFDDEGDLRILAKSISFYEFCSRVFDQIRPYVAADRNAGLHLMQVISNVAKAVCDPDHDEVLRVHARELLQAAEGSQVWFESDLKSLRTIYDGFADDSDEDCE